MNPLIRDQIERLRDDDSNALNGAVASLMELQAEQSITLGEIKQQTTLTNGRVTTLEARMAEVEKPVKKATIIFSALALILSLVLAFGATHWAAQPDRSDEEFNAAVKEAVEQALQKP